MKKTKFVSIIVCLLCAMLVFSSCTSNNESEPKMSDTDFIQSMSKALENRWAMSTKDEENGKDVTVEMMNKYIQAELDELTPYETAQFEDTKLQEKAIRYINCLKDSKEHIEYYFSDNYEENEKWYDIYNTRSVLIKDFVENYGLTVSKKYQNTLNEFLTNGKSVESQEDKEKAMKKLVDSLEFKQVKDDGYWKTYQATLNNTSEYDIKYVSIDISLLDKNGTIIGTEYANAENVSKGKKALLEFNTDEEFSKIEMILDYYETN